MDVTAKTGLFTSSLSARRAWIEMSVGGSVAEVDYCRSPQGERG